MHAWLYTCCGKAHSSTATDSIAPEPDKVQAEEVSKDVLHELLPKYVPSNHPEAAQTRKTITRIADILAAGTGGGIIAIVDKQVVNSIDFHYLDDGHLTNCYKDVAPNLHHDSAAFMTLMSAFCAHTVSDRWTFSELERLVRELPQAAESLAKLEGHPKDGAVIMSLAGDVMGAAVHLRYTSETLQLSKSNCKGAGTRHNSSLAFAEWLGTSASCGVVFVRSDDGGVHCFLPNRGGKPRALYFDSVRPLSQDDILALFEERIASRGEFMYKTHPAFIRPGRRGERVLTYVNGRITSDVVIDDDTSMVIQAPTVDHENYVLKRDKFEANWITPGKEILAGDYQHEQLSSRGFRLYWPRPSNSRMVYEVTAEDIQAMEVHSFGSSWGSVQCVSEGDFLVMPVRRGHRKEVYLMPLDVVDSYSCVTPPVSEPYTSSASVTSAACGLRGALRLGRGGQRRRRRVSTQPKRSASESYQCMPSTQNEMMKRFKERIISQGTVMCKTEPLLARAGVLDERVVTCVNGRVTSSVIIANLASMVVRAATPSQELYVLPKERFEANYIQPGEALDDSTPIGKLLKSQGFKRYIPRRTNLKYVYEIQEDDLRHIPASAFESSWGAVQPVMVGDFLAMPYPRELASEVYLMPADVLVGYSAADLTP